MRERRPFIPGSVPIPNRLFDEVLRYLSNTELRVLLVVFRQTVGWREGSDLGGWRYKQRDWLTNRHLVNRTGCSSAGVSRAIQSLVEKRLIRVEDASGKVLDTPERRRRNIGRLYFALGDVDMWTTPSPDHIDKPRTTTYIPNNKRTTYRFPPRRPAYTRPGGLQRLSDLLDRQAGPP